MTEAIVGVLLLTVNPIGDRSMWSGCEMMRLWCMNRGNANKINMLRFSA
jgi:hypothetical protein